MKKIFIMMIMAAIMCGCHKDNITGDIPPMQESNVTSYSGKLTLNVGQNVTKAFGDNFVWQWKEGDVIIGYQNSGSKHLNILEFKGGNTFECENFVYDTEEIADFYFFYSADYSDGYIYPVQDGTWHPVLLGTAKKTTLGKIGKEEVVMKHLTSAIEFKLFMKDRKTRLNIQKAKLSASELQKLNYRWALGDSDKPFSFESYRANNDNSVGQNEIIIDLTNNPSNTVVFNVPVVECGDFDIDNLDLTLTLTTVTEDEIVRNFKISDVLEKNPSANWKELIPQICTVFNVQVKDEEVISAKLPAGSDFNDKIKEVLGDCTKIKFISNSKETSGTRIDDGNMPIYLVKNGATLEIHTSADKFKANSSCSYMFERLSTITSIDFGETGTFDASNVSRMSAMFRGCANLKELNLSIFPTSTLTSGYVASIFEGVATNNTGIVIMVHVDVRTYYDEYPKMISRLGSGNFILMGYRPRQ